MSTSSFPILQKLSTLVRYCILTSTTEARSGHPTSSLSATDCMVDLFFGGWFRADLDRPEFPNNDRCIFSKGHAAPLLYALYTVAGKITEEELFTLRKFGSRLEGHPMPAFPYTEAATGSLGQGLSIGVGMALAAKSDSLPYRTYVLLGDSEMAEGSVWEALQIGAHYRLDNLVGILDVNRLGQSRETMLGHDVARYKERISSFGWDVQVIDGHTFPEIHDAFAWAMERNGKPKMIIARTLKGKGVSFIENKEGWHGKPLSQEELEGALQELGEIDMHVKGVIALPEKTEVSNLKSQITNKIQIPNLTSQTLDYPLDKPVATRKAYGNALLRLIPEISQMVVLDAEVSNSTFAETVKKKYPDRFFEMYIAEQNMVGVALGLARRGKLPFVSTFAAFLTRAFDQIRMAQYSDAHIVFVGSHAGVSIGEDGSSQMGLEDLAMFRSIRESIVLYPADAISTEHLVEGAVMAPGIVYLRTTRKETPILYRSDEQFPIGGSKVLRSSEHDVVTVVAAGITLHEALAAHDLLAQENIAVRVIDCYSVKPLDTKTLLEAGKSTRCVLVVEDHYPAGGLGEAIATALAPSKIPVISLAVRSLPRSGPPDVLLAHAGIDRTAIVAEVKRVLSIFV